MSEKSGVTKHTNALVICCNGNWLPYAGATLLSCVQQGSAAVADAIIVVCDASEEQISSFNSFLSTNRLTAELVKADLKPELYEVPTGRVTVATLLRLKLGEYIPVTYQRLLYLDCDILALAPVRDLFTVDLKGKCVGAVVDYFGLPDKSNAMKAHLERVGLPSDSDYFNSGVMLFDWPRTVKERRLDIALERLIHAVKIGKPFGIPDQDALNLAFQGSWLCLPMKFNLQNFFSDYFPIKPVFRHFTTQFKPWQDRWAPGYVRHRQYYINVFSNSDWKGMVSPKFAKIAVKFSIECYWRKIDIFKRAKLARTLVLN